MIDLSVFTQALTALLMLAAAWFGISIIASRNDVADIGWGLNAVIVTLLLITTSVVTPLMIVVTILVGVWGMRLSWHIGRRVMRTNEDARYAAWRASWGSSFEVRSFLQVFLLQSVLLWVVLAPVLIVFTSEESRLGVAAYIGIAAWIIGFIIESLADTQLARFVHRPENKGKIMQSGLWKYSRHPNYFGEIVQWWGIGIIALSVPYGWAALIGPWLITMLIVFVSGVPLAEARMAKKEGFEDYKKKTSVLVPWILKQ